MQPRLRGRQVQRAVRLRADAARHAAAGRARSCFFFRAHRESIREQLFGRGRMRRELLFGLALIPASFLVVIVVLMLVQLVVPSLRNVPHNPLADLAKNRWRRGRSSRSW